MITGLGNQMYNGESYEEYVRSYRVHIVLFISSVVVSSVGFTGVIVSIPLLAFKEGWYKNKKDKLSLNFNIDLNSNFSLFMQYRL